MNPDTPEIINKRLELGELDPDQQEGDPESMDEAQLEIAIGIARRRRNANVGPGGRGH